MMSFTIIKTLLFLLLTASVVVAQGDTTNYPDGNVTYPDRFGIGFREGSTINITWTTKYKSINLFYSQYGDDANSQFITSNLQQNWFSWVINASYYKNLTSPLHLHIVSTDGSNAEQLSGGFWSQGFYVFRDAVSPSGQSSTPSNTPATTPLPSPSSAVSTPAAASQVTPTSTPSSTPSNTPSSTPVATSTPSSTPATTMTTLPHSTLATSTTAASAATSTGGSVDDGLSPGAKAGVGAGVGVGTVTIVGLIVGAFFWGKRRREPTAATGLDEKPAPPYEAVPNAAHRSYGYYGPAELGGTGKNPVYEAPDPRNTVHELGDARFI